MSLDRRSAPGAPPIPMPPPPVAVPPSVEGSGFFGGAPSPTVVQGYPPASPPGYWVPTGRQHKVPPVVVVLVSVVCGVFLMGILAAIAIPTFLAQRQHHVGALPMTLSDAPLLSGSQVDTVRQAALNANTAPEVSHVQLQVYGAGPTKIVAEIEDVPADAGLHTDAFFRGLGSTAGLSTPLRPVANGSWTGATQCGSYASGATLCAWVDNGTSGMVIVNPGDDTTALVYLQALRSATER